ncbi:MAG: glycosyltransferase family 39 protein [Chthoniobacterales bacterium]
MRSRILLLFAFLLLTTTARFLLANSYELSPDEAYYALWAQHPDIAYYSKGPGVAMAILASTSLFGQSEFGVRFFSPLLGLGTSLAIYFLARRLFKEKIAFWSVISLNLVPIFNIGSVAMTIDPLSIFFWTVALNTFWLALEHSPKGFLFWPLTGLLIGLGFLCKYTNAFQLFSIVFFLSVVPKYRVEFRRRGFYFLLLFFVPFLLPPLVWNQQHEWITLEHLSESGGLDHSFGLRFSQVGEFVAAHFGVYSPLLFAGLMIALFGSIRKAFQNSKICFLLSFSWPLLVTYLLLSFQKTGEPNWTAPAFVSLGILATWWWFSAARDHRLVGGACITALIVAGLTTLAALDTDFLRMTGIPLPYRLDPSSRLRGWKTVTEEIERFRSAFEKKLGQRVFLIGNKYQTASMLSFYLKDKQTEGPGHPPVYIPESQDIQNQFSFWPRYDEFIAPDEKPNPAPNEYFTEEAGVNRFVDRTALFITDRPDNDPPQNLQNAFTRCELVAVFELERRDLPLRQIRVFACYQYQTLPL